MKEFAYFRIDAFTSGNSSGNPAGVMYLNKDETISEEQMQEIAKKEKGIVSEVVFCRPISNEFFDLKYYSSECEVDFCGHGTIACMYHLIKHDQKLKESDTIAIRTKKGDLTVINALNQSDSVFITAPAPQFIPCSILIKDVAESLGTKGDDLEQKFNIAIVNAGLSTLIVPVSSLERLISLEPDFSKLQRFCLDNNVDIVLVFSTQVFSKDHHYRSRVFAPKFGYLEDPATGSGNSAFGYYLMALNLWDGSGILSIEQGPVLDKPNLIKLGSEMIHNKKHVIFGGSAAVRSFGG